MQVRDVLFVEDLVDAFLLARKHIDRIAGHAFNIGGGLANAVSVIGVVEMIGELTGEPPKVVWDEWRAADQRYYVSDTSAFGSLTGWKPRVRVASGLASLHEWLTGAAGERPGVLVAATHS
jgi:CDP-paratose 2-epimerase